MHTPDPLKTMRDMMQLFHVRLHLFCEPYKNLPELDFHLREHLFQNYDYHDMIRSIRAHLRPSAADSFVDAFGSHYVSFLLETKNEPSPYEFAVMGPYRYETVSEEELDQIMAKHSIPQRLRHDLAAGLGHVPVIQQRDLWVNLQIFLISGLIGRDGQLDFISPIDLSMEFPAFSDTLYNMDNDEQYRQTMLTEGYNLEEELLNAVKKGNIDQAIRTAIKYVNFQIKYHEQFGLKPRYALLTLNTLLRRAAMEAGVHVLRLDETYVKYNRLVDSGESLPVQVTYTDLVTDYCKLVSAYSSQNYSTAVWQSLNFIDFNYRQDISLHRLADMFHVSDGYLSASFKRETGSTVTDYLNRVRVSHAQWLLETTGHSVQEIGERCGFSDSSYFTRIFKRYAGQSPLRYRITRSLM